MTENEQKPPEPEQSTQDPPEDGMDIKTEIMNLLRKRPDARRALIKVFKAEAGVNIESILEEMFGEMPDKKRNVEEMDIPMVDVAASILEMKAEGYEPAQIARQLNMWPVQVTRILTKEKYWSNKILAFENAQKKKLLNTLPLHLRVLAKFGLENKILDRIMD